MKLTLDDIADLRAYEREREGFRQHVIALKKRRRVHVGPFVTLVFENRQTLWLRQGERALAADVAAAGDRVLLGTDHRLRLYDRAGQELAVREVPTAAWGVVMVPDRPLAVVAHGDGSIRWYSLRDDLPLAEIAGLFVHRDGRRWVAWTADGFFAHGDFGGEALVGFQQNGTRKAPTCRGALDKNAEPAIAGLFALGRRDIVGGELAIARGLRFPECPGSLGAAKLLLLRRCEGRGVPLVGVDRVLAPVASFERRQPRRHAVGRSHNRRPGAVQRGGARDALPVRLRADAGRPA